MDILFASYSSKATASFTGHNVESKLGTSVLEYIITPTHQAVYQGKRLKSLSIGDAHLLAVDTSGKLYAVGSVGLTNITVRQCDQLQPIETYDFIEKVSSFAVKKKGEVYCFGEGCNKPRSTRSHL